MSCGAGGSSFYPNPNDRRGDGVGMRATNADAVRRQRAAANSPGGGGGGGDGGGYRRFYSARLNGISNRITDVVAEPSSARLRDVAMAVLGVYALYRSLFTLFRTYLLVAREPVALMCVGGQAALGCTWRYMWAVVYIVAEWAGDVAMWWVAGAVLVFFAEEIARQFPRKAKA
ncbi:hypothetical protein F503_07562 [Ophiostoma piceae UAMH 11346]|uniref:Uncharacterized protein n=1 Tax=Ophiostoma piceae (strain UAMH 11346) TaxID=1262450 RepID=S3CCR4_OPHP1|nr:hypothetical protein F503_07562 [Ophiostoma piceae UAMH 11346]